MSNNNESVQFLIEQGWEINPNRPDDRIAFSADMYMYDDEFDGWMTIEEALHAERMNNPEAFAELEMMQSLDGKHLLMFRDFLDS